MQLQYQVAAQAIERDGKKYAIVEVIDESENRNKWRINSAGKARALTGLLEAPLLGPPFLAHGAIDAVGRPVDFESNHSTKVLYEIKDPVAWERIKSGEWGPVSPQLTFLKDHYEDDTHVIDEWRFDHVAFVERGAFPNAGVKGTCEGDPQFCGFSKAVTAAFQGHSDELRQDVAGYSNNRQPDREKIGGHSNGGVIVKNSNEATQTVTAADAWNTADAPDKFFAVVPDEAKGPDGKKSLRKLPLASVQKKDLDPDIVRNALARFNQTDLAGTGVSKESALPKICSAAKQFDIQSELCGTAQGSLHKEVNTMSCEHDKVIAELTDKNKTLDAQVKDLTEKNKASDAELKQAKASSTTVTASKESLDKVEAELKVVKAENESFKAWKQAREDADHMERVEAVLDLRVKAGLLETKDVAAAIETFKKLDNEALDLMTVDLTKVHGKFESLPSGPKARLIPSSIVGAHFNPTMETVGSLIGVPVGQVRAAEQPGVKA